MFRKDAQNKDLIRTMKVEIMGDALELVGVFQHPVEHIKGPDSVRDQNKRITSCFLKGAKVGTATVKITPVGVDGKDRSTYEIFFNVKEPLGDK